MVGFSVGQDFVNVSLRRGRDCFFYLLAGTAAPKLEFARASMTQVTNARPATNVLQIWGLRETRPNVPRVECLQYVHKIIG